MNHNQHILITQIFKKYKNKSNLLHHIGDKNEAAKNTR